MNKKQKLHDITLLDKITSKSTFTEKSARELSEKINRNVAKRLGLL